MYNDIFYSTDHHSISRPGGTIGHVHENYAYISTDAKHRIYNHRFGAIKSKCIQQGKAFQRWILRVKGKIEVC